MKREKKTKNQEQGSQSYRQGYDFEQRVAELYRLLHYDVEHGRLFSGRQVDLFLKRRIGDIEILRAVECKSGPVGADQIDSFHAKLLLVRRDFPAAMGSLVSGSTFSDAVSSHAASAGIHLILFRDLSAQLFDGNSYITSLLRELASNERYPVADYVEPYIGLDTISHGELAIQSVSEWLEDPASKQLTILGDVGTGKSFLSRMVAYKLAEAFIKDPLNSPLPMLVDLRNADRQFSLEGLVLTHLATSGLSQVSFDVFQYSLSHGQIVVIFDGFDEMASRVTPQVTTRNFHELVRCVQGQAKVLLTCRTHYFKSRSEEEEVVLGGSVEGKSDNVRELYVDLISRKGFTIAYLRPFSAAQIEQYVKRVRPSATRETMAKINQTYNLIELSQRPMLLEMIVKSIDKLGDSEINQATLYEVFTNAWLYRDQWRDVLTSEDKLNFLKGLAKRLWQEDLESVHYRALLEYINVDLATRIANQQELVEIDNEIRTASFLTRNDTGYYGFGHKSYQEYFYAQFLAEQMGQGRFECLYTRRLSPEVISFLGHILTATNVETSLEEILQDSYKPMISENALTIVYGLRRNALIASSDGTILSIQLPQQCSLRGAQLEQIILEGAILRDADLRNVNFSEAVLSRGDFVGSDLSGAILTRTGLAGATLQKANMKDSAFKEANLESADISYCSVEGADFTDAQLLGVRYDGVDFSHVKLTRAILSGDLASLINSLKYNLVRGDVDVTLTAPLQELWDRVNILRAPLVKQARQWSLDLHSESEDLVDEAILRFMRDKKKVEELRTRENAELFSHLKRLVRGVSIEATRRRKGLLSLDEAEDLIEEARFSHDAYEYSYGYSGIDLISYEDCVDNRIDPGGAPDQRILVSEIMTLVSSQFSQLAVKVFELYFEEGMSVTDIAADLKLTRSHVTRVIKQITEEVRAHLTNSN